MGPALEAADKALETKNSDAMLNLVGEAVKNGIEKRFREVVELSSFRPGDVETGRKYVAAYVEYVHYIEGIYNATTNEPADHHAETSPGEEKHGENHKS